MQKTWASSSARTFSSPIRKPGKETPRPREDASRSSSDRTGLAVAHEDHAQVRHRAPGAFGGHQQAIDALDPVKAAKEHHGRRIGERRSAVDPGQCQR